MRVHGQGLLISGPPGSGKSRLALELLRLGHSLVVDDSPILTRVGSQLQGRLRPGFEGLLHLEPEGLVDVRQHFGPAAFVPHSPVEHLILLGGEPAMTSMDILGIRLALWPLPARKAQASARLIHSQLHPDRQCL